MYRKFKIYSMFISLIVYLVICISGCSVNKQDDIQRAAPVKVMLVSLGDIRETIDYVGDIKAQNEALVYPKVSGKILEKLKEEGEAVEKGDIIAYIDRDEVGFKFEKAPVESALSGIMGRVYVDKGVSVTPQTPVALVVDMDNIKINLDLPEKYLPKIAIGQIAEIETDAYPGRKFTGKVSKISPVVDLYTRSAPVEIFIPNEDHSLKSGMFAKVKLVLAEHKNVPVILKEAIIGREADSYVYVIDDKVAHKRKVRLGMREGAYFEVLEGLQGRENIVVVGQQKLHDGQQVILEEFGERIATQ